MTDQTEFLSASDYIDWTHPQVAKQAQRLAHPKEDTITIARRCFTFVRDEIRHSQDHHDSVLTARASEVLNEGTGFCYAKSHLLAALLRANQIPAALCYQRFATQDQGSFTLHGLNAVYLSEYGWVRVDPRGNKPGVDAQFTPPHEQLAFALGPDDEDLDGYWSLPDNNVIAALTQFNDVQSAAANLPSTLANCAPR